MSVQRHWVGYHHLGEFALPINEPMSLQKLDLVSAVGGFTPVEWTHRDYHKNENTNLSNAMRITTVRVSDPFISPNPHNILSL